MMTPQSKVNLFLEMSSNYANFKKIVVLLLHTLDPHRMEVHFLGSCLEVLAKCCVLCFPFSFFCYKLFLLLRKCYNISSSQSY